MNKLSNKSTLAQIRERFDAQVDFYSNLETAQTTLPDAALAMDLITAAALNCNSHLQTVLDIGCGAGNNTLKLLQKRHPLDCTLLDLSGNMLQRARERVTAANPNGTIKCIHSDFRTAELPVNHYDTVIAAAVFHHLRDEADWEAAFAKLYQIVAPGGTVWITDLICHSDERIQGMMKERYGRYLEAVGGSELRQRIFDMQIVEDSPRPVLWQLELLKKSGFKQVELLHKTSCFAAFGAIK